MTEPKYDLTSEEALIEMDAQLEKMCASPRGELDDLDPDTAFEKGYEAAIFDFRHYTGPSPETRY